MTMALYTSEACAHQYFPGSIYPVEHSRRAVFFIIRSALIVRHGIPVKGGGYELRIGRIGERSPAICSVKKRS